jgi:beta-lactamase regulating signal transducer with metallopeptidase domain
MSSLELMAVDWLGRGWLLILAFTAAVLVVIALRKPCRRLFGAERAFQLWSLVLLAMLFSQLPHAASTNLTALPALVYMITSVASALPSHVDASAGIGWRSLVMLAWCAGMAIGLASAAFAQWRYRNRLRGATSMSNVSLRWPVLRATSADVGPALVGAWRTRIVLPADFERRYDTTERALILAHEAMHARRRDGWWCLLAQIVVAMFWFHPLAWWALGALRHDQELACDAAVLREHGAQRRSYANAMLKTQSALFALPVGCPWSPRHPLTERIAMLKLTPPGRLRRIFGNITGLILATIVAGSVYATSAMSDQRPVATSKSTAANEYQLDMMVELGSDGAHSNHAERMTIALCMAPGVGASATTHGWKIKTTTLPETGKRVRIDLTVAGPDKAPVEHVQLHGALGEALHTAGKGEDGKQRYAFDVTPLAGCPARTATAATSARLFMINQNVKNQPARTVAESMASKAGLELINPEALDNRPVTLNFEQIPAERALQLVANIDGKKATFDDKQVRFENK